MSKYLKILLIGVVVLGLLILLGGMFFDSIVKTGIETLGPQITGTSLALESVDVSLLSGKGQVTGIQLGNPKGFHTEGALKVQRVSVNINAPSVLSNTIVIKEIMVNSPVFTFEGSLSGSNFSAIQQNVDAFVQAQGLKKQKEEEEGEAEKTVEIHHFIINNATVNVSMTLMQGKSVSIPLPDIHLKDIGKESGGTSFSGAVSEIFQAIYKAIFKAVSGSGNLLGEGLSDIGSAAKDRASKVLEGVKGILGE